MPLLSLTTMNLKRGIKKKKNEQGKKTCRDFALTSCVSESWAGEEWWKLVTAQ